MIGLTYILKREYYTYRKSLFQTFNFNKIDFFVFMLLCIISDDGINILFRKSQSGFLSIHVGPIINK